MQSGIARRVGVAAAREITTHIGSAEKAGRYEPDFSGEAPPRLS
jgi:hypothetical protein